MDISVKGLMISIPWRKIRRPQTRRLKQRPKGGIFSKESEVILPNGKLVDGKLSTNFAHIQTHTIHVMVYFVYLHLVDLYGRLVDLNVGKYTIYGCYGSHVVLWNLLQTFELAGFTSAHPLAWTWVYSQGCSVGTWSDLRKSAPWKSLNRFDIPSWELTYPLPKVLLKMIFLFPMRDMLVPWRVLIESIPKFASKFQFYIKKLVLKSISEGIPDFPNFWGPMALLAQWHRQPQNLLQDITP